MEFHLKYFLTDKSPYRALDYSCEQKRQILDLFFDLISMLEIKVINIVINKNNIKTDDYDVLDKALTYNIQRIENDLKSIDPIHRFLIITDEGRVGKMVKTTRKIQKINYISSKIFTSPYRNEIEKLIEDPLPKRSDESFFIQIADTISYIVQLYSLSHFKKGKWANRVLGVLNYGDEIKLLNKIKNVLNIKASTSNEFGIVHYPK